MEFSRDGQHTIRCVITEDEILELGFTLDEIVSNGARTQEFMNQIFDLAEQEFETKFDYVKWLNSTLDDNLDYHI